MSNLPSAEDYAAEPVRFPPLTVVDVTAEAAAVTTDYRNQVLTRVNTSCLRLAVMTGEYPWHYHPDSDELFLIVEGCYSRARGRTVNLCFEQVGAASVFDY